MSSIETKNQARTSHNNQSSQTTSIDSVISTDNLKENKMRDLILDVENYKRIFELRKRKSKRIRCRACITWWILQKNKCMNTGVNLTLFNHPPHQCVFCETICFICANLARALYEHPSYMVLNETPNPLSHSTHDCKYSSCKRCPSLFSDHENKDLNGLFTPNTLHHEHNCPREICGICGTLGHSFHICSSLDSTLRHRLNDPDN